jgi:hypothetical protein
MKKKLLAFTVCALLSTSLWAQTKGLLISEVLTNPDGKDSPLEYVELLATTSINFSATPYTIVFTDNGSATSNGWKAGGSVTYAFVINTGSVIAGQVVYVGGTSMAPLSHGGIALRTRNTSSTNGDVFGSKNSDGVLGNGGDNCDGVAVFNVTAASISASTVPVDAIFFGDDVGDAYKSSSSGYQLPVNDRYAGGKLRSNSYLAPDPGSDDLVKATSGTFNTTTNTFTTNRQWSKTNNASYNTTSIVLTGNVPVNVAPTVVLAAPVVSGNAPATVGLSATATDSDGSISKVEFFNGTVLLATKTAAPYTYSWTNVAAGTYTITAKATDNNGAVATSAARTITVNSNVPVNAAPTVVLAAPVVSGNAPATVGLSATAADTDGSISKVEFFNGTVLLATKTATPYTYSWTNVAAGTYALTAKATDNSGASVVSAVRSVTVKSAVNTAPTLSFNTSASKLVDLASGKVSCVMNNASDPVIVTGLDINVNDDNLGTLVFSMTSSKTNVVPNANFTVTGTGTARKFNIRPTGVGYSTITLKVTDAQGLNKSVSLSLAVSASLATASTRDVYHTGVADGSTGIPVDENYMFVADDETNVIKLYSRANSGLSIYQFDLNPYLNLDGTEVDMEGSFRSPTIPNRIYWMGSLSNSKSGEPRPDRNRIFATDIIGTGANATLKFVGYYSNLRSKIITWGNNNGYKFTAKAATGIEPKRIDGFNIEGMEMGPDGKTLYMGFRAPYVGSGTNKALICPLQNFESWFGNGSPGANPVFGSPIELNLNNHGIRSLSKNASGNYIIVAGSYAATGTFGLYAWNGQPGSAPQLLNANLANLKPEGILEVPENISGSFTLGLISDLGADVLYNDGLENKEVVAPNHRKFLSSTIVVNGSAKFASKAIETPNATTTAAGKMTAPSVPVVGVYPNPARSSVTIAFAKHTDIPSILFIYDVKGVLMKEVSLLPGSPATFDCSDLEAGMYFIKYKGLQQAIKFVKL